MDARATRRGLALTELGFGTAPVAGMQTLVSEEQAAATLDAAWDAGFRYFDTAPHYGLGLAERRLGAALAGAPADEVVVSTKVGRLLVPNPGGEGRLDDDGFAVPAVVRRQLGLQPRRRAPLARGEPRAARTRPRRHRLPARPRRPLGGGLHDRRRRPRRAARPGRRAARSASG